jgi:hypothetical protein
MNIDTLYQNVTPWACWPAAIGAAVWVIQVAALWRFYAGRR